MKQIVIDARQISTSSGRYVNRLLYYLQKLDESRAYTVLLGRNDLPHVQLDNTQFKKVICKYKNFSFGEQLGMAKQLRSLRPDLVHFTFPQQPVFYRGKTITTIHDLTTTRFSNPAKIFLRLPSSNVYINVW